MKMTIERKRGLGIGAVFFSIFGALWLTGASELAYGRNVPLDWAIWVMGAAIFLAALRVIRANKPPKGDAATAAAGARRGKIFMIVNVIQYGAIFIVSHILNRQGLGDWMIPGVMLIVGLHFLPLAKLFGYRPHYVSGAALVALALIYPFAGGGPLDPLGCLGAGLILWGSAIFGLAGAIVAGRAVAPRLATAGNA